MLALFAWLAWSPVATVVLLVLMGAFGFGTVPGLQSRIMRYAASAPTLASGANMMLGAYTAMTGHNPVLEAVLPALDASAPDAGTAAPDLLDVDFDE